MILSEPGVPLFSALGASTNAPSISARFGKQSRVVLRAPWDLRSNPGVGGHLQLADQREAVAHVQHDTLDAAVLEDIVVELADTNCFRVLVLGIH